MMQTIAADWGDWVMFRADRKASYKQLIIDPADQATAIIALKHPGANRRYGFVTRTLIFGAAAAVLRYNVISRLLVALVIRYMGIALVCYFDDFAATIRPTLGQEPLDAFALFCSLMGFQLEEQKSDVGPSAVFLGRLGSYRCADNGGELSISPPGEKRVKW